MNNFVTETELEEIKTQMCDKFCRFPFELDESELPALSTAELRSLLTDIEAAYALYGDDSGTEPGSGEWSEREEKMETLDDLSDAVWDVLDSRGE